ncbi:type VII secretion target [Micromonospora sp. RHAY321]|uniref:type VII secretion target n=1 Tax=Micromonospora sp. RHAY321 TaxID=2944807 RepID=UPI00207D1E9B|nr:type VII secretion target [Micromonospora sp. RHAY321]MCO1598321.1 type VII secretion target [Micromonospora sp. RHAY321]
MTEEPFTVQPEELRAVAVALDGEAHRLALGLAGVPGLLVPAPGWRASAALAGLEAAGHAWLCRLGARVATTAGGVRAAAEAYETVDDRAAARFAGIPR